MKSNPMWVTILPLVLAVGIVSGFSISDVIPEAQAYGPYKPAPEYESLTIESDKQTYSIGEIIYISGTVEQYHENQYGKSEDVQIILHMPNNRVMSILKADVSPEKEFSISIDTSDFKKSGEYKIKANYGKYSDVEELTFRIK